MGKIDTEELLFYISKEIIQAAALEKIGRTLTEEELDIAKKGLEWGLLTDIDSVYNAIFDEIV